MVTGGFGRVRATVRQLHRRRLMGSVHCGLCGRDVAQTHQGSTAWVGDDPLRTEGASFPIIRAAHALLAHGGAQGAALPSIAYWAPIAG